MNILSFSVSCHAMEPVQLKFKANSPMMIAGPTGAGKTVWTHKLLNEDLFTQPISSVLYCYGVHQPFYESFTIPNLTFHQGVPSLDTIERLHDGKFHIVVLDDLMEQIISKGEEVQDLFTKLCHHYNITAIFVTQNIFAQGKYSRTIGLNTHYLVLFQNKRDESQSIFLGKQLFPNKVQFFLQAFEDAVSTPHGYLLVDCHPQTPKEVKLRTHTFSDEYCTIYINKN